MTPSAIACRACSTLPLLALLAGYVHAAPPITEPVEVEVINMPTVSVDQPVEVELINTPTINVEQPLDVEILNTPTVNVAPQGSRIQDGASGTYAPGDSYWTAEYGPMPEGESLIVEYLTLYSVLGTATDVAPACKIFILTEPGCRGALSGKIAAFFNMPRNAARDYRGDLELTYASTVQMFVEETQSICVRCDLPDDQDTICGGCGQMNFSGHIVPAE